MADHKEVKVDERSNSPFSEKDNSSIPTLNNDESSNPTTPKPEALRESVSEDQYPPGKVVAAVMGAMFLAAFLVALDRTIIATAIPVITNHFNSLGDVGWYASAYLLCMCAFQLIMGRIYTFYNPKWVFLTNICLFELGSLVCGAAPNSTTLIVGRAIAGAGSSGIFSGAIIIIVHIVPLHKRPAYTGLFGAVFGVASVAGPLLGGVFTDKVSWRWCFYINLPIGGVAIAVLFFALNLPSQQQVRQKLTIKQKIMQLDPIGSSLFLPSIICVLLALQNGGTKWAWSSGRVIALLVLFVITMIGFIAVQVWKQEQATLPPRIMRNRSIAAGSFYAFCNGAGMMIFVYFVPIWFQAIKGVSAVESGIRQIPMVLGIVVSSIMAGVLTKKTGYYTPWMFVSSIVAPIGAGLITTWHPSTKHSAWIGYQVMYGLGLGFGMQQPSMAAQTVLSKRDVSTGASLMFFMQSLGGAVFASIANNVFDNKLVSGLASSAAAGSIDPHIVVRVGATDIRKFVPANLLPVVVQVYNDALQRAFYVGVAVCAATIIGTVFMEWKSVKKDMPKTIAAKKAAADSKENSQNDSRPETREAAAVVQEENVGLAPTAQVAGVAEKEVGKDVV